MNQAEAIVLYRPMLHSIAEGIVGCAEEAEDIVQDTFLKWLSAEQEKIENTKAYLIKAVTNNCLSHIQSLKKRKEQLFSQIDASQISQWYKEQDFHSFDMEAELSAALFVIQSKLEPLERAVFILKEAFSIDYDTLQEVFEKKKDHCRQLVCRAKKKISDSSPHFQLPDGSKLFENFVKACDLNNVQDFIQQLKADVLNHPKK